MELKQYILKNSQGMTVKFLNLGGIVSEINVPDKLGTMANVVLSYDDVHQFANSNPSYYGALVGRFANRMGKAEFDLDGKTYPLFKNDGNNALHGGKKGFDKVSWRVEEVIPEQKYQLSYMSPHMEEGYPGNLSVQVIYSLNEANEFSIEYLATTDQKTVINLTSHCYFNLSGNKNSTMLDHDLMIDADSYTVTNSECIPTGEVRELEKNLDFRKAKRVGTDIESVQDGYNHNYILNHPQDSHVSARLLHPASGRSLELRTTEPGLQLYTGYFLEHRFAGLCLEAQHFADSPHHQNFPSTELVPGEAYYQKTIHRFSWN